MPEWTNETELFALMQRELYTPVVGDILDELDRRHQFLPQAIQPLRETMRVAGRAMPVLQIEVFGRQEAPFGRMTEALDALRSGEIYLATGSAMNCANWGEIMTAAARARGALGAVVNGLHRDTPKVLEQDFPVFSRGPFAQDSAPRMKVVDFRCFVEIDGVPVHPGDLVFGDRDGVLVIPQELVEDVVTRALAKARTEKLVRQEIERGMLCTEAFAKYGVL